MTVRESYRRGSRRMACSALQQLRYPIESGERPIPSALGRHEASCLHCQAEAIRHRQIMRGLREMIDVTETVPYDLAAAFDRVWSGASLGDIDDLNSRRRPSRAALASAASLAAISVAVVAGRRLRSAS